MALIKERETEMMRKKVPSTVLWRTVSMQVGETHFTKWEKRYCAIGWLDFCLPANFDKKISSGFPEEYSQYFLPRKCVLEGHGKFLFSDIHSGLKRGTHPKH